jgi:phage-related protein
MASPSRTLKLTYLGDASQLNKTNKELDNDFTSLGDRFKKFGVNAAKAFAVAGAAAGAMAIKFGKDAINSASDLNESVNALEVVFGDASEEMLKLSDAAAKTVGLSKTEFNSLSVSFSAFTKRLGKDNKGAVAVTDELTKRIADFASVMNLEVSEAAEVFQSTLAGSSEVARRFGIDTSAAAVTQYALENGLIASKKEMDENARIQATYGLIMRETDQLTGDFAATSDQLANSQRILKAEFENTKAEAGQALLPIMQELVGFINRKGLPAFKNFIERVTGLIEKVREFWQTHGPNIKEAFDSIKTAVQNVKTQVENIYQPFQEMFGLLDENTKKDSGPNRFVLILQIIAGLLQIIGQVVERMLQPLVDFVDLIDRIAKSKTFKALQDLSKLVYGPTGLGLGPGRSTPAGPSGPLVGLQGPARPVFSPVQGPNRPNINITINGAMDREGTARDINRILNDSARRTGPTQNVVFTP